MKKVAIIGAGAVGHFFANRFDQAGYSIELVVSRSSTSATKLASVFKGSTYSWDSLPILQDISVLVIAVPDDCIRDVVDQLNEKWRPQNQAVIFHCSGLYPRSILDPLASKRSLTCAIHPLRSIVKEQSIGLQERVSCGIEIEDTEIEYNERKSLDDLLDRGNLEAIWLREISKSKYHLAASMVSNFTVSIQSTLEELCKDMRDEGSNIELAHFGDLLLGALKNVHDKGPKDALTGPILRGDVGTIEAHLQILEKNYPNLLSVYKQLAKLTLGLALEQKSISDEIAKRLNTLLAV